MKSTLSLLPGEEPMPSAPVVDVNDTLSCIPQHYLVYKHSRSSVESILLDIDYHDHFLVFVNGDNDNITLQVGIIGYDNYRNLATQSGLKIVYGRKWRVEPQLPSSEIVQTVYLALQKAREHEVRELFKLTMSGMSTTPFSCHQDLPMLAYKRQHDDLANSLLTQHNGQSIPLDSLLACICFDGANLTLKSLEQRPSGQWLLDIEVTPSADSRLPETQASIFTLLMTELDANSLLFQVMDHFLMQSQQHLEEHFRFKGFPRFSRKNKVCDISQLSSIMRRRDTQQSADNEPRDEFATTFESTNYETDRSRVPQLADSMYSRKLRAKLASLNVTEGILPV